MANIKFNYMYRDGSNFKAWSSIVFSNPENLTVEALTGDLSDAFETDGLFIAQQVRLPEVFLYENGDAHSDDHCFHEFSEVEDSFEIPSDQHGRSISQFLCEVQRAAKWGWLTFEPNDRQWVRHTPLLPVPS